MLLKKRRKSWYFSILLSFSSSLFRHRKELRFLDDTEQEKTIVNADSIDFNYGNQWDYIYYHYTALAIPG